MSAAAGALLAGQINDRIGLVDDLALQQAQPQRANRRTQTRRTVLTVGKQLDRQLYIGYEYGISSAEQSVKLIYRLTRAYRRCCPYRQPFVGRRAEYTIRFDRLFGSDKKDSAGNGKGK
nr:translocation/assembly module TamB domain-containing protein [Neisseria gonorrhoeae]